MPQRIQISGLVRTANAVRRDLGPSLTVERRESLRSRVLENLRTVDDILRRNGAALRHLPAPSQRAYQFLAGIDWQNIPTAAADEPKAAAPTIVSWRGLGALIDRALDLLATDISDAQLNDLHQRIERSSRQIELAIQRDAIDPQRMSDTTRSQRGWLGFFSERENLSAYLRSRQSASRIIDAAAAGSRHYPPPMVIHFRTVSGIYRLQARRGQTLLWMPTPMVAFDEQGFSTIAAMIFHRQRGVRQRVMECMTAEGYQTLRAEIETLGGIVEQSRGAVHDLSQSFDRVNARYFDGNMHRPHLTWNRTFTGRKFGHYNFIQDTVMVSRTLDSADVPAFVVDFLVFHELLHKFHGLHWVNGRGYAHTGEFYECERRFERYAEAEQVLDKLARQMR